MSFVCCKECKDRYVGCHSKCDKYLAAKADLAEMNKKRKAERDKEYDYECMLVDQNYKRMRRR